jgi:transcriptional regulator with GAF, ATPase, and Fis domain
MVPLAGDDGRPSGVGALFLDISGKSESSVQIAEHDDVEPDYPNEVLVAEKSQSVELNDRIKILKEVSIALSAAAEVLEHTRSTELYHSLDLENGIDFNDEVRRFEINLIQRALKESAGNQKKAAGLLKLKHTTLHTKIKRYDISTAH